MAFQNDERRILPGGIETEEADDAAEAEEAEERQREPVEEATWRAVEGTAEATVRLDTEEQCCGPMGFVDVVVRDLVLEGERGTVTIEEVVFTDVFVGWFASIGAAFVVPNAIATNIYLLASITLLPALIAITATVRTRIGLVKRRL